MSFQDIIGQQGAIARLRGYIDDHTTDGTYLFTGAEGIGKLMTAIAFAQALNCVHPGRYGCGECPSCVKIAKGAHPDVHVIDCGNDEIKVEDVRSLQGQMSLRPYEGSKKVFLVNNAHNVNHVSANALLKTLEEPPKDSLIILITDKPAMLISTIISRCRVVKFSAIGRTEMEHALSVRFSFPPESIAFYASFSEGRIGAAKRLQESDSLARRNEVVDQLWTDTDGAGILGSEREEIRFSLNILAAFFRDMYFFKSGFGSGDFINQDRADLVAQTSRKYSVSQLDEIMTVISESFVWLEQNVNVKLLVSNVVASIRI